MTKPDYHPFELGDWLVEPEFDRISRDGKTVPIQPKTMELLVYLARHQGHVVSADDILDDLWGDVVVASGSVYFCISQLREALGDDSHHPTYIETIAKRGYQLIAPVRFMDEQDDDSDVSELTPATNGGSPKKALVLTGLFLMVLLVALYQFLDLNKAPSAPENSIAVLPFTDLSPEGNQEYFADGIAEELLNALAKVPQLRVTGRTSSFTFRDGNDDLRVVGKVLGVAHVLEGSVRRDGSRVRVTAQLIDAKTGFHLWSETYNRELTDIFDTQDEISAAIVVALSDSLGLTLPSAPKFQQTANSAAYDEYLLGILEMGRRTGASLEAAKQHLERALELDPGYAPAHARLSISLGLLPQYNNHYTFAGIGETWAYHAERAMALAPNAPESLAAKGYHAWKNGGSSREVGATLERVIALNPSYTDVLNWLSIISVNLGDYQASIDLLAQALRVDPLGGLLIYNNAFVANNTGRFDEARALAERIRTIHPSFYGSISAAIAEMQGLTAQTTIHWLKKLAVVRENMNARKNLANMLAFGLGLADEALSFDHRNWGVMVLNGQTEEALHQAENFVGSGYSSQKGQLLLAAGRPGEAVGYLNQAWDQALATASVDWFEPPTVLVDIGRARQMTGDQAGGREALEAALAVIARRRAVGNVRAELDWAEGVARYFLGQKEAGLRLVAHSLERGFVGYLMQPQYQPLTSDPAFAPILAAREVYAAAERDKFLTIICNGGNPAPEVWTPLPETCEGYVED